MAESNSSKSPATEVRPAPAPAPKPAAPAKRAQLSNVQWEYLVDVINKSHLSPQSKADIIAELAKLFGRKVL